MPKFTVVLVSMETFRLMRFKENGSKLYHHAFVQPFFMNLQFTEDALGKINLELNVHLKNIFF